MQTMATGQQGEIISIMVVANRKSDDDDGEAPRIVVTQASAGAFENGEPLRQPLTRHRRRGILAFLPATGLGFPHDADAWKTQEQQSLRPTAQRKRSRGRRNSPRRTDLCPPTEATTVDLAEWTLEGAENGTSVVPVLLVFFSFDPFQRHSVEIRNRLVDLHRSRGRASDPQQRALVRCVALSSTGRDDEEAWHDVAAFLAHTGFCYVPLTASLRMIVPAHVPGLKVYHLILEGGVAATRAIPCASHEELALEWNSSELVLERWTQGRSGLTLPQQALAAVLFPMCAIL